MLGVASHLQTSLGLSGYNLVDLGVSGMATVKVIEDVIEF